MADKRAFELKSGPTHWETMKPDGSGLLRIGEGEAYVTADPNEIALLRQASDFLKESDAPAEARSRSKVSTKEGE